MAQRNSWVITVALIYTPNQFAGSSALDVLLSNHRSVRHDAYNLLESFVFVFGPNLFGHRIGQQITMVAAKGAKPNKAIFFADLKLSVACPCTSK